MNQVYLLMGSNQGRREENIKKTLELILLRAGQIGKRSSLYETEAWGIKEQPAFLNLAILLNTHLTALNLLKTLKVIEKDTGRIETVKWGPRVIDIDILFYNNEIIDLPDLKVPHRNIQERRFTLVPLNEIAPKFIHPVLKKSVAELLLQCTDTSEVRKI